jgi:uncharacterized protein
MKLLLSVLLATFLASGAHAQMAPMPPSLTISGEAKEQVAPDQATITATVTSRHLNLNEAKKHNDAQMEKVVEIAKQFDIPKTKITPSNLNINPEYNYNNVQKPELIGYMVSRTLRIAMDKIDIHEKVLSALVDAKIDQVSGVEFSVANPDAISDRLRVKAMENAKTKAAALAAAAGMKLGRPITINAGGGYIQPPMPMQMMAMRADMAEKSSVAPSLPGMLEMRETVNVVFALE